MKNKVIIIIYMLLFSFPAYCIAAEITLQWDANVETDLAGYYIYYKPDTCCDPYNGIGANDGDAPIQQRLTDFGDPDYPQYTISGLDDNRVYYFVVSAFNNSGYESGFSTE